MQLVDNKSVARGLVRVQPGEDVLEALQLLAQAAGWREAFVTGCGSFQLVEINPGKGEEVTLENAEVLSLSGHLTRVDGEAVLVLRVTVLSDGACHRGRVVAAVADPMLLMIEAVTPEAPSRVALAPNVLVNQPPSAPAAVPTSAAAPTPPAAAVPPAKRRAGLVPPSQNFSGKPMLRRRPTTRFEDEDYHENPLLDAGDMLKHPQLGLCKVEGEDPSGGTQVRVGEGRLRVLRLDALIILAEPEIDEEGRKIYTCTGPRPRRRR